MIEWLDNHIKQSSDVNDKFINMCSKLIEKYKEGGIKVMKKALVGSNNRNKLKNEYRH